MLALGKTEQGAGGLGWLEGATWRGFSAAGMALPAAVLLLVGAAGVLLGMRLFRGGEG